MPAEPSRKRVIAFVDGQNLFYGAKDAFGYRFPNYDITALSQAVCRLTDWELVQTRFYTGVPLPADDFFWCSFWTAKLAAMGRQGVQVFSRPLRYRSQSVQRADGSEVRVQIGQEKGIDIRIALDLVGCVRRRECDVALIFSQDQDLSEVAQEVRAIAVEQQRWVKVACAFPDSADRTNHRGIDKTDWIRIRRHTYDQCLDTNDYRPPRTS